MISIIVPVYKVEKYLDRCIESILQQTYEHFELILVDDGSPDSCPIICDEWKEKDKRIRVVHKKNGGLSDARNAGLKIAKGEYIAFIDSDDWIGNQYLEYLLNTLKQNNLDIVECDIVRTDQMEISHPLLKAQELTNPQIFSTEDALKELIEEKSFHQYVWNKLYKAKVIDGIKFEVGKTNEDEFWTYQVFGKASNIGKIQNQLYFYYQRDTSIMGENYSKKRLDALEAKEKRQKYIESKFPKLKYASKSNLFESCMYQGQMIIKNLSGTNMKEARSIVNTVLASYSFPSKMYSRKKWKQKVWLWLSKISFWNICKIRNKFNIGI